ncbi:hypothetical protein A2W12_02800 [Candidatus Nomurabacteria bacterium RBG_16_40_11]|nr:MAG: hypothetical protein A2W12_02800 [Candidatus Nomurabacteria bacterium RBG_16_40_11]
MQIDERSSANFVWSRIIFSPSLKNFRDPDSRFCVLAKHRSASHKAKGVLQGAPLKNRFVRMVGSATSY